jgi:predicted Fe-Mo cluster-binding NifX family protein
MTIFPVDSVSENSIISTSLEKSKYFVVYNKNSIKIEPNPSTYGVELIQWLNDKGVSSIIIKEMEINPYNKLKNSRIKIYHVGDKAKKINEIINSFKNKKLELLNNDRMLEIVKLHEGSM